MPHPVDVEADGASLDARRHAGAVREPAPADVLPQVAFERVHHRLGDLERCELRVIPAGDTFARDLGVGAFDRG